MALSTFTYPGPSNAPSYYTTLALQAWPQRMRRKEEGDLELSFSLFFFSLFSQHKRRLAHSVPQMEANERSSGGSSFVRLVTPFIYSGFTKGSLPALGPHALDAHTISLPYTHTQTRTCPIHTRGMAGPLLHRADRGLQVF